MQEEIVDWAEKNVKKFNELSQKYETSYYTQSPLSAVGEDVELMVVGINPKGGAIYPNGKVLTCEEYLNGNPAWNDRFLKDGSIHPAWGKDSRFLPDTRFFLGYGNNYTSDSIDSDEKTIWTNLSPFVSPQGSKDLPKELMQAGVISTIELIKIVKPQRIVLLGNGALEKIKSNMTDQTTISYLQVFENVNYLIGQLYGIPIVNVCHPSGQWKVSNTFTSVFIFLHKLATDKFKSNLENVADYIRKEFSAFQTKVRV